MVLMWQFVTFAEPLRIEESIKVTNLNFKQTSATVNVSWNLPTVQKSLQPFYFFQVHYRQISTTATDEYSESNYINYTHGGWSEISSLYGNNHYEVYVTALRIQNDQTNLDHRSDSITFFIRKNNLYYIF